MSFNTFNLNEHERAKAETFVEVHYRECKEYVNVQLSAKATGIGYRYDIKCMWCKKEIDLSDYDSW